METVENIHISPSHISHALSGVEIDFTHYTFSNWLDPRGVEVDITYTPYFLKLA